MTVFAGQLAEHGDCLPFLQEVNSTMHGEISKQHAAAWIVPEAHLGTRGRPFGSSLAALASSVVVARDVLPVSPSSIRLFHGD
jgi:hypothetical protein